MGEVNLGPRPQSKAEVRGDPSAMSLASLFRALAKNLDINPHETEPTASPSISITMAVGVRQNLPKYPVEAREGPIAAPAADPHPQWQPRIEEQEN